MLNNHLSPDLVSSKKISAIRAVLTRNIEFEAVEGLVQLKRGTEFLLDASDNVGFYADNHFDIFDDEFSCLQ